MISNLLHKVSITVRVEFIPPFLINSVILRIISSFLLIQILTYTGKHLGKGTFGQVKLGQHTLTGEKVAIKILEKDKINDQKDVERITREIKILKKVRHPNVI